VADPKSPDKQARIIEVATRLFSQYGFKRTSVDLLAAEAGVAKPTIYAYFDDKEAVFRAVVESVSEELLEATRAANREGSPIDLRLAAMLSAKFTRYWALVHASPHAQELMDSQSRLGAEIISRLDRAYLALLVEVIEGAKELDLRSAGLTAHAAAQMLVRAAAGAAYDATSTASHEKHLTELVRLLVRALRKPQGAQTAKLPR
jgi:TetR/AcrR family transcriptional regulator, mexJK operon transcriptional repressor